jgi:regulator of replication initiation timing
MKRLSEMENALGNATGQVEILNSIVRRFEVENSVLKTELDAAKLRALESAASYQEVVEREQIALKRPSHGRVKRRRCCRKSMRERSGR